MTAGAARSILLTGIALAGLSSLRTAAADQTDPALPALFDRLRDAGPDTGPALEAQIWVIWLHSDRAEVATAMQEGVAAMDRQDPAAALAAFDRVVALAPDFAEGWNKRATVLYLLGRYPESIHDIDRVLALEPRHFGALSGLGLCEAALHRDEAALAAFRRAAAVDPAMRGVRDNIRALTEQIAREKI